MTKEQKAEYMRHYRARHRDRLLAYDHAYNKQHAVKHREHSKQRRLASWEWYRGFKATLCCSRCPESHPACLDFHHIDAATKFERVSEMVQRGYSRERIEAEIAKCVVLCSNCHRKLHWEAGEWGLSREATTPVANYQSQSSG